MRQPTFSRRRTRQQRLLRTGIGVVVIVVVAALIANLAGGKKKKGAPEPGVATVAFTATYTGAANTKSRPAPNTVQAQGTKIVSMLNNWYQEAFVNTKDFGDGTFPDIQKSFAPAARTKFETDKATLTIGDARTEVKRVDPTTQTAKVTVYFDKGKATIAIAAVHFVATATMNQSGAYPLTIDQTVTYTFTNTAQGWVVSYYSGKQTQKSVVPSPSATAS